MKRLMIFIISLILFIPSVKADTHRYLRLNGNTNIYIEEKTIIAVEYELTFDNDPSSSNNFNTVYFNASVSDSSVLKLTKNSTSVSFPKGTHNFSYALELVGLKPGKSEICVTEGPCFEVLVQNKPTTTTTKTTTTSTRKSNTTASTTKIKTTNPETTSKRNMTTTIKSSNTITTNITTTTITNQETTLPIIEETTTEVINDDKIKEIPKLNNLVIKNHKIDFYYDVFEYIINVKSNEKTIDIETQCNENYTCSKGTFSIDGKDEVIASVIDDSGLQTDYKIIIKRQRKNNFNLLYILFFVIMILILIFIIIYKKTKNKKEDIEVITLDEIR